MRKISVRNLQYGPQTQLVRGIYRTCYIMHCRLSYRGGLRLSLCIMGYETQHPHSQKEHTELYNILKFGVDQANVRPDTAIQKLQFLL